MTRLDALRRFYELLDELSNRSGGPFLLSDCSGRLSWPTRGVYLFFEEGEQRSDSGSGPRVVRVGTHALTSGSRSSLKGRLSQHAGTRRDGAGNHRGSIFRLLVGEALMTRGGIDAPGSWGVGSDPSAAALRLGLSRDHVKREERALEQRVSVKIGAMPFLFVSVPDDPGPDSARGAIERNAIALLSNYGREALDPPSENWLGRFSRRERVRSSGLWNNNHVEESSNPVFLAVLEKAIDQTGKLKVTSNGQ